MSDRTATALDWLEGQIGQVEAELQPQGPTCQLDRRRASPPDLKRAEGRYATLRLARRLLAEGRSLQALREEAGKARAFLAGGPLAQDRRWQAYQRGVLEAVEEVLDRVEADARAAGGGPSNVHR